MAQGHIIPMIDIAKVLAQHGVIVTIFTTPKNASRFNSVIARAVSSGLQIRQVQLYFPSKEVGLPEGCECFDMLPSNNMTYKFYQAVNMLHEPAGEMFEALTPKPSCIISDFCIPWTTQVAEKYRIPRISFHGFSCFYLHCLHQIHTSKVCESITSESEYFTIPGILDQIQVTKEQAIMNSNSDEMNDFWEQRSLAEMKSYGVIINTFEELEKAYVRDYKKLKNDKVWCIGPVSLCNKDGLDKAQRGNADSINKEHHCMKWLDLHQPKSVLYVCFGSLCNLIHSQLVELALALEDAKRPFIWVIREGSKFQELEKWISEEGFEERTKGRGLIIRGWAPQVLILSHSSIGGFLTHCGWNSTLEGVSAGVPMVTWPLFSDQFLNEKLVTQVLKTGVSVGVEVPMKWGEEEKMDVLVKKEDIKKAICLVIDDHGEESKERRERARKLSEIAKIAVEKGGSSHLDMTLLIHDIMQSSNREEDKHIKSMPKESKIPVPQDIFG
uniref:Glycosyltransferase n=2 Tax=Cajanus cajan TaxID=3821 RepID=A0A151TVB3_CAJCA|nr:Cytokinin-O-glucosyltransferase 1 [Cajanus cajan]